VWRRQEVLYSVALKEEPKSRKSLQRGTDLGPFSLRTSFQEMIVADL
jgi:hypothetical protein